MQPFNTGGGSGGGNNNSRAEAERWLEIAEKLLSGRDLIGTKTFAIRARESDPRIDAADLILTVADTLIAGEKRINNQPDWYGILQLPPPCSDLELIATKYRQLALLLNPHKNRLPYADEAFTLVSYAWSVLSDPSKKFLYDNDLNLFTRFDPAPSRRQEIDLQFVQNPIQQQPPPPPPPQFPPEQSQPQLQPQPQPIPSQQQQFEQQNVRSMDEDNVHEESEMEDSDDDDSPFWTACPYCYYMYEYPGIYKDCTFRCHNCQRAFHGVKIVSPPVDGNVTQYCCWGFIPLAGSMLNSNNKKTWTPFSQMVSILPDVNRAPLKQDSGPPPKVHVDDDDDDDDNNDNDNDNNGGGGDEDDDYDDEIPIDMSSSDGSDADWGTNTDSSKKKKAKYTAKGKSPMKHGNHWKKEKMGDEDLHSSSPIAMAPPLPMGISTSESSMKGNPKRKNHKGKVPKEWGKLDLNVEFSKEEEEPTSGMRFGGGGAGAVVHAEEEEEMEEEEGIEGIGFFEGLDEFLNSLPILNVVGEDKVKAA